MVYLASMVAITAAPDRSWVTAILEDGSLLVLRRGGMATRYPEAVRARERLTAATRVADKLHVVWADTRRQATLTLREHTEGSSGSDTSYHRLDGTVLAVGYGPSTNFLVVLDDGTIRGIPIRQYRGWMPAGGGLSQRRSVLSR